MIGGVPTDLVCDLASESQGAQVLLFREPESSAASSRRLRERWLVRAATRSCRTSAVARR